MISTKSEQGIGYSVAELNGVRHMFVSAMPRSGQDLEEQVHDALRTVHEVIPSRDACGSIVHQAVFLADLTQVETCRKIIKDFYGDKLPATSYIPQPPCDGKLVAIEALGVGCGQGEVRIQRCCEQMVAVEHSGVRWVHVANLLPSPTSAGVYNRSLIAFEKMAGMLAKQNVKYDQVIRTWLYLGAITGPEADTQRYKELNRARTDFYNHFTFGMNRVPPGLKHPVYPASTGIGTDGDGIVMSCIALETDRTDLTLVPLENPQQISAFDYGANYSPRSPKFARAMAVAAGDSATVFVSGTASITDSESRYDGDPGAQTDLTLDNIEKLIAADNFRRHGVPHVGATLQDLSLVRVYIKRQQDYEIIRQVCERRFGERPTIYAVADVCRPELLVEIEAVAWSSRK